MNDFIIRNPKDEDAEQIERMDFVLKMLYLYHGDLEKKNMFCAVNREEEIVAVAHLMEHATFHAPGHDENHSREKRNRKCIRYPGMAEKRGRPEHHLYSTGLSETAGQKHRHLGYPWK